MPPHSLALSEALCACADDEAAADTDGAGPSNAGKAKRKAGPKATSSKGKKAKRAATSEAEDNAEEEDVDDDAGVLCWLQLACLVLRQLQASLQGKWRPGEGGQASCDV